MQFGLDATRTGIIETPRATELAALISAVSTPTPIHQLIRSVSIHVGASAAESLVADLVAFRILVPADPVPVVLLGHSALAKQLTKLLRTSDVEVRAPMRNTTDERFVARADDWLPVVSVDQLGVAGDVARMTKHRAGAVIPVSMVDSRVIVGPLHTGPGVACPLCSALHLADVDSGWEDALSQFPAGPHSPDPVVLAAGIAAAATYIRRVAGVPDPPGVTAPHPVPGELMVADPFAPTTVKRSIVRPHPRCGACG